MKKIKLTRDKYALVDDANHEWLNQFNWHYSAGYAVTRVEGKRQSMHRLIMDAPQSLEVEHQDNNGLNNQRSNIRLATHLDNMANKFKQKNNKSGYKGVCWSKGKWTVQLTRNHKYYYLGRFNDKKEAALAYNQAAIKYVGKFAKLNSIS